MLGEKAGTGSTFAMAIAIEKQIEHNLISLLFNRYRYKPMY